MTGAVVLGMHRSGTSTVAGLLAALGMDPGADPRTARSGTSNAKGFWEIRPLSEIDEEILRGAGGSWAAPPCDGWQSTVRPSLERRAARTLARHLPPSPWVWKDPRLCLTLPLWVSIGLRPTILLLVHRDPAAVAASLEARNGFTNTLGLALWERYNLAALERARGFPTIVVGYERLTAAPAARAGEVAQWLQGVGLLVRPADPGSFVDASLDHARAATSTVPAPVEALQHVLQRLDGFHPDGVSLEAGLEISTGAVEAIEAHRALGIPPFRRGRRRLRHQASRLPRPR